MCKSAGIIVGRRSMIHKFVEQQAHLQNRLDGQVCTFSKDGGGVRGGKSPLRRRAADFAGVQVPTFVGVFDIKDDPRLSCRGVPPPKLSRRFGMLSARCRTAAHKISCCCWGRPLIAKTVDDDCPSPAKQLPLVDSHG